MRTVTSTKSSRERDISVFHLNATPEPNATDLVEGFVLVAALLYEGYGGGACCVFQGDGAHKSRSEVRKLDVPNSG
jgi:hypothetical protein